MSAIGPPASDPGRSGVFECYPLPGVRPLAAEQWPGAIQRAAADLGITRIGFAPAAPFPDAQERFAEYIRQSRHGSMDYLARQQSRAEPHTLLAEARTVISVALAYAGGDRLVRLRRNAEHGLAAGVAGYALGPDYHHVLKLKLRQLAAACATIIGRRVLARACVDTAPILEREAARRAGLGFIGKSTMSIIPGVGSFFVLGELLVDIELPTGAADTAGCGRCRACLDACPTSAFSDEYTLDAKRCIAYLTIEHRGAIPQDLRQAIGRRVFGCDICQDVCPYNSASLKHPAAPNLAPRQHVLDLELTALLQLTAAGYRRLARGSALARATRRMLQRNAAVALGNSDHPQAVPALLTALRDNPSELVRGHVAWALGRLKRHDPEGIVRALEQAHRSDPAASVRQEAREAIASVSHVV